MHQPQKYLNFDYKYVRSDPWCSSDCFYVWWCSVFIWKCLNWFLFINLFVWWPVWLHKRNLLGTRGWGNCPLSIFSRIFRITIHFLWPFISFIDLKHFAPLILEIKLRLWWFVWVVDMNCDFGVSTDLLHVGIQTDFVVFIYWDFNNLCIYMSVRIIIVSSSWMVSRVRLAEVLVAIFCCR